MSEQPAFFDEIEITSDEELILLREIARLANEYRKHKMHEDSLSLQKLGREWHDKYGKRIKS